MPRHPESLGDQITALLLSLWCSDAPKHGPELLFMSFTHIDNVCVLRSKED